MSLISSIRAFGSFFVFGMYFRYCFCGYSPSVSFARRRFGFLPIFSVSPPRKAFANSVSPLAFKTRYANHNHTKRGCFAWLPSATSLRQAKNVLFVHAHFVRGCFAPLIAVARSVLLRSIFRQCPHCGHCGKAFSRCLTHFSVAWVFFAIQTAHYTLVKLILKGYSLTFASKT